MSTCALCLTNSANLYHHIHRRYVGDVGTYEQEGLDEKDTMVLKAIVREVTL